MVKQASALREIIFEPATAGGGSFWAGDHLLATLDVFRRFTRQGRLSIQESNQAFDLVRVQGEYYWRYRLNEGAITAGQADWVEGVPSAQLIYQVREYTANLSGLFLADSQTNHPSVIAFEPPLDWQKERWSLTLSPQVDLPLVALYFFVVYDFEHLPVYGQRLARRKHNVAS